MTPTLAKHAPSTSSADIIRHLNVALRYALTAINQRFLHARMLKHQGVMRLADREYKESLDIMRHADRLVERILSLSSIPNLSELAGLHIGAAPEEILRCTVQLEQQAEGEIEAAIMLCESAGDEASALLLTGMHKSIREHVAFLRQQLDTIASIGAAAYLQTQA